MQRQQIGRGALLPLIVLAMLGIAAWYLLKPTAVAPVKVAVSEQPAVAPPQAVAKEPADVLSNNSSEQDPIAEQAADEGTDVGAEVAVAPEPTLPALDESDALVRAELLALKWQPGLAALFITDEMIRRFVVQIDNIAQGRLIGEQAILHGLKKDFVARPNGQAYQLDKQNYARYEPYLALFESVPPQQVAAIYHKLHPLLDAAYQELGYGDAKFDDRVQQAIQVLLNAPDVTDEPDLVLPSVHYAFANPELEQLGMAQKQIIRLGQANATRLKRLLVQYQPLLKQK